MSDETFDRLFQRFGVWDCVEWSEAVGHWFRSRVYFDGAWLEGHKVEPLDWWGA